MAELKKYKRKWSDEELERAKVLYFKHEPLTVIARITGISRGSLQHYVRTYWAEDRTARDNELLSAMSGKKRAHLTSITKDTLEIMQRALHNLATAKEYPTTKEALDAAKILELMSKLAGAEEPKKEEEFIDVSELDAIDPFAIEEGKIENEEAN